MKNGFIIIDNTANQNNPYISDDGSNCSLRENAAEFSTKEKAEQFANSLSENENWYSIEEFDKDQEERELLEMIENDNN